MNKTLYYLYDPLCGWCYGSIPALSALVGVGSVRLELMPTGLFSGAGARQMDEDFASYAWMNDERIARVTGQQFTAAYRYGVLADRKQIFDSGPATLALTAVATTFPGKEYAALKAIQHARYVDGSDVTSEPVLVGVLKALGLDEAANLIARSNSDIFSTNAKRITHAQELMRNFGASGVPTLILESGGSSSLLVTHTLFSDPDDLCRQIEAA
jgi:putative protein-disulfide isomerase